MNATGKRALNICLSVVVVAAVFGFALPAVASYSDVWDTIATMSALEIAVLVALSAFNLWAYVPTLTAVLPGLHRRQAFVVNNASTAIANTVPAGAAFGIGITVSMYRSWGFSTTAISLAVIVSGIWNTFVKLGLPIVALAFLAIADEADASLVAASMIGVAVLAVAIVVFGMILRSDRLAAVIGEGTARVAAPIMRFANRPPPSDWGRRATDFRMSVIELVGTRWQRITVATAVSHLSLFAVLLMALRYVGVSESEVSWAKVLAAFAFGRLITAVPLTPGGLGVIELGYVAALTVGASSLIETRVVAAVLLFRAMTYFPPIVLGALTSLFWIRNTSWRQRPPPASTENTA